MPPKNKKSQQPTSIAQLFTDAAKTLERSIKEPNIAMYKPHSKQVIFHSSPDYGRIYIGGNRTGKSYSAVVEDIWWATGTHPYRETPPPPVRGRVVAVDYVKGVAQIILPLFKRLVLPSMLVNGSWEDSYSSGERVLTFANGSTIEFMSYEQETEKFAGTSRHFIHYDEEPPKNVYDECQMRILDTDGEFWISMTPVEGMTWLYETLYEKIAEGSDTEILIPENAPVRQVTRSPSLEMTCIEVDMDENPYLSERGKRRALNSATDEESYQARKSGKFVQMQGLIFPEFDPEVHVIEPFIPDKRWDWYMSIDHGWNNPTAILWHAVSPDGTIYTFSEHYKSQMTIEQHATTIHMREAAWGKSPEIRTGDPAMKQTSGITATSIVTEYADRGIYLSLETVPRDVSIGLAKMHQYLRINPGTGKPKWYITADCVNFIREIKKLRYKTFASKKMEYNNNKQEQIHKKDDHACDSARYFSTFLPDLSMSEYEDPQFPVELPKTNIDYVGALLKAHETGTIGHDTQWDITEGIDLADM